MAMTLTQRERLLIDAFRGCDERTKVRIEQMANPRQDPHHGAGTVLRLLEQPKSRPRRLLLSILKAAEQLTPEGQERLVGAAGWLLQQYPCSAPHSAVDTTGQPALIAELVRLMERTSDPGLANLQPILKRWATEFAARPNQPARIIQIVSVPLE